MFSSLLSTRSFTAMDGSTSAFLSFNNWRSHIHKRHPCCNFRYVRCKFKSRNKSERYLDTFGLTDDGDFAILGVNVDEPDDNDEKIIPKDERLGGDVSSLLSGTIFDTKSQSKAADTVQYKSSEYIHVPMGQKATIAEERSFHKIHDVTNEEALGEIMEYIVELMPTISEDDIEYYAAGLNRIGFHPKCITMCELKLEDLDFMKVLHRRYFFNEVTGVEHPWEV